MKELFESGKLPLSVIIPAMNEQEGIKHVLSSMPKVVGETIVVDSSDDDTPRIARDFGARVFREDRGGYGRALQTGIRIAKEEIVVFIDADGTYDPIEIPRLVKPILQNKLDAVLGNRLYGDTHRSSMKPLNRVGNAILSFIFRLLFQEGISDSQCGLRAIRKSYVENLEYTEYGMPYVTEQLIRLARKGARIGEIPVTYRARIGKTKLIPWKDGLEILRTLLVGALRE